MLSVTPWRIAYPEEVPRRLHELDMARKTECSRLKVFWLTHQMTR